MEFKSHIRLGVLKELAKGELSGYDLMQKIGHLTDKKPSPGYIYPLLKEMKIKSFLTVKSIGRRKIYHITSKGRKLLHDLECGHKHTAECMKKILSPIVDKEDFERVANLKKEIHRHRPNIFRDMDMIESLLKEIFRVYDLNDVSSKNQMKKILKDSAVKLRKIAADKK